MWVKICANTNLDDALLAAELGADALGFVFAPSARQITPADAARIIPHLPPAVEKIGVFPAWNAPRIAAAAHEAGLTGIQLHGGFNPDLSRELATALGGGIAIIQTLHWDIASQAASADRVIAQQQRIAYTPQITRILIDSKLGAATGGTGIAFDWNAAHSAFRHHPQTILAGGLAPENVQQAIRQTQPWGVDIASGVESCPGRKDPAKLRSFLAAARAPHTAKTD